jgi:Dolichyl-phosphate-mannose-protein mannosyltransferase
MTPMDQTEGSGSLPGQGLEGDEGVPERQRARMALRRESIVILVALGMVVALALGLHLWGMMGDLPYPPDVDEPDFMHPALWMLGHRTLDPNWFAHPASTIIYPIAALSELWYQVAKHVPPFAHAMPGIGREFVADPTPFYVIGRLVSIAYGVGCVLATWLLARRIVGNAGGVLAALLLPATAMVVAYGQLVRTDMAGTFFALVAVWLALRAMDDGRFRDWALAAVVIGLAISTRYFYAALVVPYGVAALLWLRSSRARPDPRLRPRRPWAVPIVALLATPAAFAITSPFVVVHLPRVLAALRADAVSAHPGADGLTPVGNAIWYVSEVIPATFSPVILALAIVGVVVVARLNWRATAVVAAYAVSYLAAVSAYPLHWSRYVIPLVPVVGVFAAGAVLAIGAWVVAAVSNLLARRGRGRPPVEPDIGASARRRRLAIGLASAMLVVLLVPSVLTVAAADRLRAAPSTRVLATEWIVANVPPSSRIAQEMYTAYLGGTGYDVLHPFSLGNRSIDAYRADGYRYLVTSSAITERFQDASHYPSEYAFYRSLEATGHLLASFQPGQDRSGPLISIYEIAGP